MGIAFGGGGGSKSVFGSSDAGNFLTRLTSITALLFLLTSLGLAHFSSHRIRAPAEAGRAQVGGKEGRRRASR